MFKNEICKFYYFDNNKFYLLTFIQSEISSLYFQCHQKSHHIKCKIFSTPLKVDISYEFASWKDLGTNPNHEFEVTSIECNSIPYFILYVTSI